LTEARALTAFQQWQRDYPDLWEGYDTQNFRARIAPPPPPPPVIRRKTSLDLLPAPFAWIDIPAGKVTLVETTWDDAHIKKGQKQTFDVPAFQIAKYPLTNAQFRLFVKAGGYDQRQWWTDEGWAKRESEGWTEPRYWQDTKWNQDNYPVVGVSWFEVVAYGLWLSEVTGEAISLPTEQQWQRAAQGDTNRAYPYGDKFDSNKCNFNTEGTTPVTQYEGKGDSPFKVVDMSGNVWEWCATDYETGVQNIYNFANRRVLRGGSWGYVNDDGLRVGFRDGYAPVDWVINVGCRLARS
jgi:formylglycine-generating enzyme required for sulfatase activity